MKTKAEVFRMSIGDIRKDIENIVREYPQLEGTASMVDFNSAKGAICNDYFYLLQEVEKLNDTELQNYLKFKECSDKLQTRNYTIAHFWDNFNMLDGLATTESEKQKLEKEYQDLKDSLEVLRKELEPTMRECYKDYKSHCEFFGLPYSIHEEFEKDDDDIFSQIFSSL